MTVQIDAALVRRLLRAQFPQWAHLPVTAVPEGGWNNRTFRLGETMLARLPSAERYVAQIAKEQAWLPRLAPALPLPIPEPLGLGRPGEGYPWPWSVHRWIEGETAKRERIVDQPRFATDLADFLIALQAIDASGGPAAGQHNFHRGGSLRVYDAETRRSIALLRDEVDAAWAGAVWDAALASTWQGPPRWVHGDVAEGNLLLREGRLAAVIDFGTMGVGDPSCDLVAAWTMLDGPGRHCFRARLALDDASWARSRGWALWKALITRIEWRASDPAKADWASRVLSALAADHDPSPGRAPAPAVPGE